MRSRVPPPLLLVLLLLLFAPGPGVQGCPSGCKCNRPQTVFCNARQGTTVPHDVPPDTADLYVFGNGITTLDAGTFASLPGLQLLDLSQNQITSLPGGVFQPLANLSNLDLSTNRLREITNETFRGLRRLERLYLGKNRIHHIQPGAFDVLGHLLELKLQDNELRALPPLRLPRLLLLDLSHNSLLALEPGALDTANVEALRLAGLGLRQLDEGLFGRLRNLHELDVSDNQLERVPPAIRGLRSLTRLRLAGNTRIAQLRPEALAGLAALQELDLSNLSLQALPHELSGLFPHLRSLAAARNPFNCVCPLSWFGPWVRESSVKLSSSEETRCHFPPKNAGQLLLDLDYADFGCPATTTTAMVPTTRPSAWEPTSSLSSPAPTRPNPTEPAAEALSLPPATLPTVGPDSRPQDCPASICLNGGTCNLGARGHLECLCPESFTGQYCEVPFASSCAACFLSIFFSFFEFLSFCKQASTPPNILQDTRCAKTPNTRKKRATGQTDSLLPCIAADQRPGWALSTRQAAWAGTRVSAVTSCFAFTGLESPFHPGLDEADDSVTVTPIPCNETPHCRPHF